MKPKLINIKGVPTHFSVGAVIKNNKGEYLLIDRLREPFGFACPAGHIDEGEIPEDALVREIEEETGLKLISKNEPIIKTCGVDVDVPNEPCSRGINRHVWHVYEVKAEGELIFKADEVKSIGWYTVEEIKKLKLELIWDYWFKKLNII